MILQPLIEATLNQTKANGNTPQPIVDFLRPLFLKEDTADGARTFEAFLEQPAAKNSQRLAKSVLRNELEGHPEAVHKLEEILKQQGIEVSAGAPEAGDVTEIL